MLTLLRGDYKPSEYGRVILPFTVLRRLDCVLAPTRAAVLAAKAKFEALGIDPEDAMQDAAGVGFANGSPLSMAKLLGDQDHIAANLEAYVQGFSPAVRDIFERYRFAEQVDRLRKAGLLYQVVERFAGFDLGLSAVDPHAMGGVFEHLIGRFAEVANETAGEHFTPREVIRLMVDLIFAEDDAVLSPGTVALRTIYDPTAGTGGMLSVAEEHLKKHNPDASLTMFGQELNDESYAICKADMLIKGQNVDNIALGNTLSDDAFPDLRFDYMLSNPPFGVEWKKVEKAVRAEAEKGFAGRFGPGLPRISDGSLLFLLHLVGKMRPAKDGGARFGIVLNGSPLFTGGAGSGESEIRRHVLEKDLVEAIIALPTDMFFNTGIATYVWVLCNHKPWHRRDRVQLIDASSLWRKMRRSQGSKRREMGPDDIAAAVRLFVAARDADLVTHTDAAGATTRHVVPEGTPRPPVPEGGTEKVAPLARVFPTEAFGYRSITVERPLRDAHGKPVLGQKGKAKGRPLPDPALRDTESVPLSEDVHEYLAREVLPHAPDAWIDEERTRVGYEIPFNRHFYVFEPPRPLEVIDAELKAVTDRIRAMIEGMAA